MAADEHVKGGQRQARVPLDQTYGLCLCSGERNMVTGTITVRLDIACLLSDETIVDRFQVHFAQRSMKPQPAGGVHRLMLNVVARTTS